MNPNDPTLLSAYLDDELDETQRSELEAQLLEDPSLAHALGELARVRDLVAHLDRAPSERDLSGPVVAVIEGRARSKRNRRRWGPEPMPVPKLVALSSGIAAAAVLLVTATYTIHPPRARGNRNNLLAQHATQPRPVVEETSAPPAPTVEAAKAVSPPAVSVAARTSAPGPDAEERDSERERQRMLGLLDAPNVRRLVVTSSAPGQAASEVDVLLRAAPRRRPRYGRLSLSPGLALDSSAPAGATVFLVVMDDLELAYFKGKLEQHLAVNESPPAPAVVTQLADVGQVDVLAGTPAGTLERPASGAESHVALKADEAAPIHRESPAPVRRPSSQPGDERPDPAAEAPEPAAAPAEASAPKPEGPATVLIWVTSAAPAEEISSGR